MKFPIAICFALLVARIECENKKLQEVFSWKIMDYAWKTPEDRQKAIESKDFIPENNLILGLDRWKNKLFVTVPRWKAGVMSTLNYINISEDEETPKPPDVTAEPPPETTEPPPETTEPPPETTEPPPETTEPPPETTEPPPETTEPPPETTEPPPETTEPPPETTEPPPETTEPPPETTEPPPETTEPPPPPETTEPTPETTEPPPETIEPPLETTEAPPEDEEEEGEDDEEEDNEEEEEEPEPEPAPAPAPEEPVISGEDDTRNTVLAMRRLISNFDYVDPKTLSERRGGKVNGKKGKAKGKGKGKGKGRCTGKGKDKDKDGKRPCTCRPKPPPPDPTTPLPPNEPPRSPPLIPYPNLQSNYLKPNRNPDDPAPITSVFRVRVDPCDRLWVMDSGVADLLGKPEIVVKPRILIYDLKTDKLIKEYRLKEGDTAEHSFFANIIVDVTPDTCDQAFAYLPDLGGYTIVVYDFANDKSWKISHNYFHFDPLAGNMNVGGVNFQWSDGIFSIALTKPDDEGYRTAYFHALASTKEFKVSTKVLRDEEAVKDSYYEYKLVGDRGEDSQSSASFIHEDTGVMFYTQLQKDSVNCWNTNKKLTPENLDEVASHNETMIFTNDIKVDHDSNLWVLTDKLPIFIYKGLDPNEINYRIFTVTVKDAIAGTKCTP